jgi:putative tryptophan/tyrosine transport system substrate-binding protein
MTRNVSGGRSPVRGRRAFIAGVAVILIAPLPGEAQPTETTWRVGVLSFTRLRGEAKDEAFRQGLRDRGYVEGQNLAIEYRSSDGKDELLPALASELVRSRVNVIAAYGTKPTRAAKQATRDIPIVMLTVLDPIGAGLVPNLARPGGNVTGLSELSAELSAKRLELLKQGVPGISTIAVLVDRKHPTNALELKNTETAARRLGLGIVVFDVSESRQFVDLFAAMSRSRVNALLVVGGDVIDTRRHTILDLALKNRLPTVYPWTFGAEAGALMSYGVDITENFRQAAAYVDKILKGAKAGDLPVQQPTKFEFVINLKTAKALGLTIPQSLLLRADHVIQ